MPRLSDMIENFLKDLIESEGGSVEITRGELAEQMNCVPSQITYVLSTRFTNGQGYLVESRRGGGGWIRIHRLLNPDKPEIYLMHAVNSMGDSLTQHQSEIFLTNFVDYSAVDKRDADLMSSAISDKSLALVDKEVRDKVRMQIFKQMLIQYCLFSDALD